MTAVGFEEFFLQSDLVTAQTEAVRHIQRVHERYTRNLDRLKERTYKKQQALSQLRVQASTESSTRENLSMTHDLIRTLRFDIDNMKQKVETERSQDVTVRRDSEDRLMFLVNAAIKEGLNGIQNHLQVVSKGLADVHRATRENRQATENARDEIVGEIHKGTIDERGSDSDCLDDS